MKNIKFPCCRLCMESHLADIIDVVHNHQNILTLFFNDKDHQEEHRKKLASSMKHLDWVLHICRNMGTGSLHEKCYHNGEQYV